LRYGSIRSGGGGWGVVAQRSGANVSELFRRWVDQAYDGIQDEEFHGLLRELSENPIELPSPELLSRELDHAHCPGGEWCDRPELH
jgi:hypothetical protein